MKIKSKAFGISPPLGLGYIAAYLLKSGHHVEILDNSIRNLTGLQFKDYLFRFRPDIVGFTTYTFSVENCLSMSRIVKEVDSDIRVILGGPHASYLPSEILSDKSVDAVVAGEGEETVRKIVDSLAVKESLRGIKGVFFKDQNGQIIDNGPRPLIENLDSIPFPAYGLLEMNKYYASVNRRFSQKRFGSIITSRGCPYLCTFCSHKMFGKKTRFRSPENVVDELELLVKKYGLGEFMFLDDTFTIDIDRTIAICDLILKRELEIIWTCNSRADHASKDLYISLNRAGCKGIHIGAESASQEMLDSMKKGITVAQVENAVALAKKYIGYVVCGFIFGMPGDTLERAAKTIEFAKKLNPDYATFNITVPSPGSEIFDQAVNEGRIDKKHLKWEVFLEMFSPSLSVVSFSQISPEELVMLAKKAFREFYFRPEYIWQRLCKIRSFSEICRYLRGVWTILSYELAGFKKYQY